MIGMTGIAGSDAADRAIHSPPRKTYPQTCARRQCVASLGRGRRDLQGLRQLRRFAGIVFVAKGIGAYTAEVSRVQFIAPTLAELRSSPPAGEGWLFELKFDGTRVQLHKAGVSSAVYWQEWRRSEPQVPRIAATGGLGAR
jgi:hypothetical protein